MPCLAGAKGREGKGREEAELRKGGRPEIGDGLLLYMYVFLYRYIYLRNRQRNKKRELKLFHFARYPCQKETEGRKKFVSTKENNWGDVEKKRKSLDGCVLQKKKRNTIILLACGKGKQMS